MYDFLKEPLLPAIVDGRLQRLSLPAVLAHLSHGEIESFPGLAAHQRQAWFHFLVQVAALASADAGLAALPTADAEWAELLLQLAGEHAATAWSLIVEDPSLPALFQPPTAKLAEMQPVADTPDAIDVLQTAKDHDVKSARLAAPEPHHWFYALLTLQTMQGYSGKKNYGIARMNGGLGSRVLVELTPSMAWGARFRRGVAVARAQREHVLESEDFEGKFRRDGVALLWLKPWDDEASLGVAELDPCFIEICRCVRLVRLADHSIVARFRVSNGERVAAKESKGALGDPFVPISREGAALTVGAGGFNYRLVKKLLTDDEYILPASLSPRPEDPSGEMLLHLAVLVRGQGKTEGLHDRVIPVGPKVRAALFANRHNLNAIAREMIETIEKGPEKALKAGVLTLSQAPEAGVKIDFRAPDANSWLGRLDHRIDASFFRWLWRLFEAPTPEARDEIKRQWQQWLKNEAKALFDEALRLVPSPSARRERAQAIAEIAFNGILNKNLPMLTNETRKEAA